MGFVFLSFWPISSDSRDGEIQSLEEKRGVLTREGRGGGGILSRRASGSPRRPMGQPSEGFYVGETGGGGGRGGAKGGGEEEDRECVICMDDFTKVRREFDARRAWSCVFVQKTRSVRVCCMICGHASPSAPMTVFIRTTGGS